MNPAKLLSRLPIDHYLLLLIGTVVLAAVFPARGMWAPVASIAVYGAVALLFFLYGARLAPSAVVEGMLHWRLQSLVFASTFILFPLLGLGITTALRPWLPPALSLGIMFVCVLPSTVQSSIAFTSIGRGNVPAALCSASVSNLFGMVVTPALVALLLRGSSGFSLQGLEDIALQLLLPFGAGQAMRPLIGTWLLRHKRITSVVDRGSILLVVYAAFSAGMVAGIWHQMEWQSLALVLGVDLVLLAIVLVATTMVSRAAGFSKEDEIAIVFCGSKKSMAAGIPMANILFHSHAAIGLIVLPLMLFHQAQLFACATLAQRYARRPVIQQTPAEARAVLPASAG